MWSSTKAFLSNSPRTRLCLQIAASTIVPLAPILIWRHNAKEEREERLHEVKTKVRIPNLQTVDDLLVERCQPGDVVLFDRRFDRCASGPLAAFQCLLGQALLCDENDGTRSVESGTYEHCGIVVPGLRNENKSDELDPSNLCLMEVTPGNGVVCHPLLTRLEMTRSRSVILIPLATPGDRRNDDDFEPNDRIKSLQQYRNDQLTSFRDKWLKESRDNSYESQHSLLSIIGAIFYATNLYPTFPIPISPSAWLVVSALQQCGIAEKLSDKTAAQTRVEDFTRDHRFYEHNTVRLRPGWKFLGPVVMREMSI